MTDYKIDKKYPMPGKTSRGKWQDLANRMKPGQSVFVMRGSERSGLALAIRRTGGVAVTRAVDNGFRVWRTE